MAIIIDNAILHVLNNDGGESCLSEQELDIDSEVCSEFLTKHVKRLLDNTAAREATFNAGSKVYEAIQRFKNGELYFKDASKKLFGLFSEVVRRSPGIPSADILFVKFRQKGDEYLAILKLNYKECFTHKVGGSDNQIVKNRAVLPFDGSKVDEACVIPYDPMIIRLMEKPCLMDGAMVNYFSELFLDCSAELSKKEATQLIQEISEEINEKYFDGGVASAARLKTAFMEEAEDEEGVISIDNVAAKAFGENAEIKDEYIALAREAGLTRDLNLGEKFVRQQFGVQRFRADNGVELKFPAELAGDPENFVLTAHADGTVSITFNKLRRVEKS